MLLYLFSALMLGITGHLIVLKFGWWAGITVAGMPLIMLTIDHFVGGNQTMFRQGFFAFYSGMLVFAFYKTVDKLDL